MLCNNLRHSVGRTLDVLVHVENFRHLEMMKDPSRKVGFEGIQALAQYWKSK